jgi:hypothetical protein
LFPTVTSPLMPDICGSVYGPQLPVALLVVQAVEVSVAGEVEVEVAVVAGVEAGAEAEVGVEAGVSKTVDVGVAVAVDGSFDVGALVTFTLRVGRCDTQLG